MLGNDLFKLEGYKEIGNSELKALVLLYKEIFQKEIISFYLSLLFQEKEGFRPFNDLLKSLNISLSVFENQRLMLEKANLLETYQKENCYIFNIKKPLRYDEFINHPIFGRMLYKKVNHELYNYLKSLANNESSSKVGYYNISSKVEFDELKNWDMTNEADFAHIDIVKNKEIPQKIDSFFDIDKFIKGLSNTLFPNVLRTHENLKKIANIADTYSIKEEDMRKYLKDSIKINPLKFDTDYLAYLCRSNYRIDGIENNENEYLNPCTTFLAKKRGKSLVDYDIKIINTLINNYHLKPEVVNVLLEYALKKCDNQLFTNFIIPLATNWYHNNVDDYQKALKQLEKPTNNNISNNYKKETKKDILPNYDIDNEEIPEELMMKYLQNKY